MPKVQLPEDIRSLYEFHEWKHACAILKADFPTEWNDILEVLRGFKLRRSHVLAGGGGGGCPILAFGIPKLYMWRTRPVNQHKNANVESPGVELLKSFPGRFGTILADPPWQFSNRTGKMAPEHRRLKRVLDNDLDPNHGASRCTDGSS